jgi:hypothetical protein
LCAGVVTETILAYGHEDIQANHTTTLEITKDNYVSRKGDCIIAVAADKALTDLGLQFRQSLCNKHAELIVLIEAGEAAEVVKASGSSLLILAHPTDIVIRKSDYICSRTLAINADRSAADLSRKLVDRLKNRDQKVKITLTVDSNGFSRQRPLATREALWHARV